MIAMDPREDAILWRPALSGIIKIVKNSVIEEIPGKWYLFKTLIIQQLRFLQDFLADRFRIHALQRYDTQAAAAGSHLAAGLK